VHHVMSPYHGMVTADLAWPRMTCGPMPCVRCPPLCQTAFFIRPTWMCPMAWCMWSHTILHDHPLCRSQSSSAPLHTVPFYTMASCVDTTCGISSGADEECGFDRVDDNSHMAWGRRHIMTYHDMDRGDRARHGKGLLFELVSTL
jgi:hypothetical protein